MIARATLTLISLSAALLTSVLAIGRAAAPSNAVFAMVRSGCLLPCVYGITPGETSRDEAHAIATALALDGLREINGSVFFYVPDGGGRAVLVALDFTNDAPARVRSIRLSPRDPGAQIWRLGDLLRAGQQPALTLRACAATITRINIAFGSDSQIIAALIARDRLSPYDSLLLLDVSIPQPGLPPYSRLPIGCQLLTRWHGFAPFHFYAMHTQAR